MSEASRRSTGIAVAVAAVVIIALCAVIAAIWARLGDVEMSASGWIAMGLGVALTLALGIGLMSLVFISSRRGYDEPGGDRC
jgi:dipeptide/tripeptide permease